MLLASDAADVADELGGGCNGGALSLVTRDNVEGISVDCKSDGEAVMAVEVNVVVEKVVGRVEAARAVEAVKPGAPETVGGVLSEVI